MGLTKSDDLGDSLDCSYARNTLWGVICLIPIALALSGRLDMSAARLVLILAWLMASFAIYRFAPILALPVILRLLFTAWLASAFWHRAMVSISMDVCQAA